MLLLMTGKKEAATATSKVGIGLPRSSIRMSKEYSFKPRLGPWRLSLAVQCSPCKGRGRRRARNGSPKPSPVVNLSQFVIFATRAPSRNHTA
jgi:hypothetical protein